jgi:hypothetical protein
MSSFARSALLWLAAAAVKGQDELAAVGLDGPSRQPKEHQISGQRRTLDMNSSVVTLKPAICGQFKTGHRDWPKT